LLTSWGTLPLVSHSSWRARKVGTILLARANMSCGVRSGSGGAISNVRVEDSVSVTIMPRSYSSCSAPRYRTGVAHRRDFATLHSAIFFPARAHDYLDQSCRVARSAPSASACSFAHASCG
jgi:hypothetical protein